MTTNYLTIMMKHFEHMNIEVTAAAETVLNASSLKDREDVYDCNRFLFVKEGAGRLIVQNDEIQLVRGKLCILLSGRSHRIAIDPDEQLILQWCHFRSSYEDRDLYRVLQIPYHIQLTDIGATSKLLERIIEEINGDKLTSRLKIKASMLDLISTYLDSFPINMNDGAPSEELQKIDLVLNYIDEHLADNITVENLAKQVFLHPNYFIVFFKSILGYSPIQYVNLRRMELAKSLLLQQEWNVSAVASKVGMQIYYFSRMFKTHTGVTPSHYRKQSAAFGTSGDLSNRGEGK
ncbi:helix-turn-helix transcriptional regulator [Cohnella abietis]|uniref:Transcriptional regulator n=1 Tax=Cohnella abietis TaxID=2507935 RepID=A0A3T1DCL7_9BACL|nr:AraC family transcriptional regulator [Cohnella abietis]BBI35774.1 transcriptional regulator [Cohnella abietis]